LFLLIFIPLRSYAGGLHLSSFWSCYIFSCLTFLFIILMAEVVLIPGYINVLCILFCISIILLFYPVENTNREVDEEENTYFKNKLRFFLGMDIVLLIFFIAFNMNDCLRIMSFTFAVVMVTMAMGKYKNKNIIKYRCNCNDVTEDMNK